MNTIKGLSSLDVQERIKLGQINYTKNKITKTYTEIFVKNIFSVLNIILFSIFALLLVAGLWKLCFFAIILFLNLAIGIFQDIRAKKMVEKISLNTSPKSIVVRDGVEREINSNEIVLDDLIILKSGMTVPSDCKIVKGEIKVNESLLTGENDPILRGRGENLYKESVVISGRASAVVFAVGKDNYTYSLQSKAKQFNRPKSELLSSLNKILRVISIITICLGIVELVALILMKTNFIDLAETLGSSLVAMIPNGMYLLTSLTLTVGVITLIKRKMLVQELYSIESLARINVMCVDKTGTLTDGNMEVIGDYSDKISAIVSHILFATKDDNITAQALRKKFGDKEIKGGYKTIFFDSAYKYSGYKTNKDTYIIGAYGFATKEKKWLKPVKKAENKGYRVLCVVENNKCIGLIFLQEHIKDKTKETIEWFLNNGVRVIVISGDSPLSIETVANKVGITGPCIALDDKNEMEVREIVRNNDFSIFGRVSPDQKLIIIDELKNKGNKVAMVGDGVNDLLALKNADCSIAMSSGSDAIKGASHLLSLDNNFSSFPKVVEEGRRVINNLQRVCSLFLIKTMFAIAFTLLFLIISVASKGNVLYPFTTTNLYPFEGVFIGLSAFLIALEPNKTQIKGKFLKETLKKTLPAGISFILCVGLILAIGHGVGEYNSSIATAIIAMNLIFIAYIWNICSPLSKYRKFILVGTTFIELAFIVLDRVVGGLVGSKGNSFILGIDYTSLTLDKKIWWISIIVVIFCVGLYLVSNYIIKRKGVKKI